MKMYRINTEDDAHKVANEIREKDNNYLKLERETDFAWLLRCECISYDEAAIIIPADEANDFIKLTNDYYLEKIKAAYVFGFLKAARTIAQGRLSRPWDHR